MKNFVKNFISYIDLRFMFIFIDPLYYPSNTTFLKLVRNLKFKTYNIKLFFIELIIIILYFFNNLFKIIYSPLILFFYLSKYRFVQLNYSQIGVLNYHLDLMIKNNLNNGYKSIIFIPKNSDFSFVKDVFKNLIIIDNIYLNLLLLPLKTCSLISCTVDKVDHYLNNNLELTKNAPSSKIHQKYRSFKSKKSIYVFKKKYSKKMNTYLKDELPNINLKNSFIFHQREDFYNNTSNLRGSKIDNYLKSINFLLSKNYQVIRLMHSKSKKIDSLIKNKNYFELNTDIQINKLLQYFLIFHSKGLLCNSSGPGSIGPLFLKPVYHTNAFGVNVHAVNKHSLYLLKKIKLKNRIISYPDAISLGYFNGLFLSRRKMIKLGFENVENTSSEILNGLKEFIKLNKNKKISKNQKKFKKFLPEYMEMKYYSSNISNNYIKKNKRLFEKFS